MKNTAVVFLLLLFISFSTSCSSVKMIADSSKYESGKTIIVGRIVIHPSIVSYRLNTNSGLGFGLLAGPVVGIMAGLHEQEKIKKHPLMTNQMIIFCDNDYKESPKNSTTFPGYYSYKIKTIVEYPFYAMSPNKSMYLYYGTILHYVKKDYTDTLPDTPAYEILEVESEYPIKIKVNIEPGDKAVYIGDIHIFRSKINRHIKTKIKDNYNNHLRIFKERFPGIELKRAKVELIK